jgi:hypothetical protein
MFSRLQRGRVLSIYRSYSDVPFSPLLEHYLICTAHTLPLFVSRVETILIQISFSIPSQETYITFLDTVSYIKKKDVEGLPLKACI